MSEPRPPGHGLTAGYTVRQHLNRSNVYDVYAVWSTERDCLCIAKVLRPELTGEKAAQERLLREGRRLTAFTHPHLVRGYEVITTEAHTGPIVVTETLTGATLSRLIQDSGSQGLSAADVAQLGLHLCSALHYLHRHNLVHMDLKPSNIVCAAGKAILLDIDLAQPPGPCSPGMGTIEYMAPEQLAGASVDFSTDIWTLGGVLYRALTTHRPFPRSDGVRRIADNPDLTHLHRPGITPEFRDLITGCFAATREERPSIGAVRQALDAILDG